ncbi:hypothetical protein [Nocardia sp. NPDC057440]|uniref:hypothetical protein n=1 Tax=Nocardia sp. NPDC057440 TaxID=3346134 RepID=UPI00366FC040
MPNVPSRTLTSLVTVAAQQLGYVCRATDADEAAEFIGPRGDGPHYLWLGNLRRSLHEHPVDRWPALVADYVGTFLAEVDMEYTDPIDADDFATVRCLLRTHFAPAGADAGIDVARRDVAPGIVQVAVIGRLHTAVAVTPEMLAHWDIGLDALFDLAEANTRADSRLEVEWKGYNDASFAVLSGSDFASAHARWLDDYPVIGMYGALFVTSHEGNVYVHPITGPDAMSAMILLGKVAANTYRSEPRPVSPAVYWWKDSAISLAAGTEIDKDGNVAVHQTPEFDSLLTSLTVTCDFGVVPAGDVDTALDALALYEQMCAHSDNSAAPPAVLDLLAEIESRGAAVGFVTAVADFRGAVLRTWGPSRGQHLLAVLQLTKDRDLAVFDVATGHLYDPRDHVDVRVTAGAHDHNRRTLPYLTAALLEDFVVGAADPDDPFLVVARDDKNYIRTRRDEWVYEIEHRAGSASEHFRVYTMLHTVVRAVIWAWACGDPSWTLAVQWRRVDPDTPGIEAAQGQEILQDELSSMASGMTVDGLPLLDAFLMVEDTPLPSAESLDLSVDPSVLRERGPTRAEFVTPSAGTGAAAELVEGLDDDQEPPEQRFPNRRE